MWEAGLTLCRRYVGFTGPRFSANALLQGDPGPWCGRKLKDSPYSIHNHPLPTPAWHWIEDAWRVEITDKTDDRGEPHGRHDS